MPGLFWGRGEGKIWPAGTSTSTPVSNTTPITWRQPRKLWKDWSGGALLCNRLLAFLRLQLHLVPVDQCEHFAVIKGDSVTAYKNSTPPHLPQFSTPLAMLRPWPYRPGANAGMAAPPAPVTHTSVHTGAPVVGSGGSVQGTVPRLITVVPSLSCRMVPAASALKFHSPAGRTRHKRARAAKIIARAGGLPVLRPACCAGCCCADVDFIGTGEADACG